MDFNAWQLRPAALDMLGLSETLREFVREWSGHSCIAAKFNIIGFDGERLLPEAETNLYRVAQETLNNIQKYADVSNVSVLLERHDNQVTLIVEDDGKGFDPEGGGYQRWVHGINQHA